MADLESTEHVLFSLQPFPGDQSGRCHGSIAKFVRLDTQRVRDHWAVSKHGVDIIRVNGIAFDKTDGIYQRVPYKTDESLRFFVLHSAFRKWGFVDWAIEQGDDFLFRLLQTCSTLSSHL